jgi:hypothetical protein
MGFPNVIPKRPRGILQAKPEGDPWVGLKIVPLYVRRHVHFNSALFGSKTEEIELLHGF